STSRVARSVRPSSVPRASEPISHSPKRMRKVDHSASSLCPRACGKGESCGSVPTSQGKAKVVKTLTLSEHCPARWLVILSNDRTWTVTRRYFRSHSATVRFALEHTPLCRTHGGRWRAGYRAEVMLAS